MFITNGLKVQFTLSQNTCFLLLPVIVFADTGSALGEYKNVTILAPERKQIEEVKYGWDAAGPIQDALATTGQMVHVDKAHVAGQASVHFTSSRL